MAGKEMLYGVAPVLQALQAQRRELVCLWVKDGKPNPRQQEAMHLAQRLKIPCRPTDAHKLAQLSGAKLHQGLVLEAGPLPWVDLDEFIGKTSGSPHLFLLALDQIEDPQNLGAILRTCAFLGVDGVLHLTKKAAPLSPAVSKASAGALESFPVIGVGNLSEALQKLKREGFLVLGASAQDSLPFRECPLPPQVVLVMGNEGEGLRSLTQKRCDQLVHIPGQAGTESLNVSVATAILAEHILHQITPGKA